MFDVLGTVADEESARKDAAATLFASVSWDGGGVNGFAEAWEARETEVIRAVASGRHVRATRDALSAQALLEVATRYSNIPFSPDALSRAAQFGRGIEPWPAWDLEAAQRYGFHTALVNGIAVLFPAASADAPPL